MVISENKVIEDLIIEVKLICEANGYNYWLAENTARDVFLNNRITSPLNNKIFMEVSDFEGFLNSLKSLNPKGRGIEHMGLNKSYPYLTLRYGNLDTMHFVPAKGDRDILKCLAVEIIPVRRRIMSSKKRVYINNLEKAWYNSRGDKRSEFSKHNSSAVFKMALGKFFAGKKQGNKVLNKFFNAYRKNTSSSLFYVDSNLNRVKLDESFFDGSDKYMMNDVEVSCPKYIKEYFKYIPQVEESDDRVWMSSQYSFIEFQNYISISKGVLPQQMLKSPLNNNTDKFIKDKGNFYHNIRNMLDLDEGYSQKMFLIRNLYEYNDYERISRLIDDDLPLKLHNGLSSDNLDYVLDVYQKIHSK